MNSKFKNICVTCISSLYQHIKILGNQTDYFLATSHLRQV